MTKLLELCRTGKYQTDKFAGRPGYAHSYVENFYGKALAPMQGRVRAVLEIGVYHGDSLRLWRDYFPHAQITGIDVTAIDVAATRIQFQCRDAYTPETAKFFPDGYFSFIIDDGPHDPPHMLLSLDLYIPKLASAGLMVIEDIPCLEDAQALKDRATSLLPSARIEIIDLNATDVHNICRDSMLLAIWK
jgi:hypothetical protein